MQKLMILFAIAALAACGDDPATSPADSPNNDPNNTPNNDLNNDPNNREPEGEPEGEPEASPLPEGLFLVGLQIAPVGGLVRPFQLEVESVGAETPDGSGVLTSVVLRAAKDDFEVSAPMGTLTDVAVDAEGNFVATFPEPLTLPGAFSPTGSDVIFQIALQGKIQSKEAFCGDVTGEITTFEFDLVGSTFAAIPWEQRAEGYPSDCTGDGPVEIARLTPEQCPNLAPGLNGGFPSAERQRQFEVILPADYDEGQSWPLIFVFHGLGGTIEDIQTGADFQALADARGQILAVPQGLDEGGLNWEIATPDNKDVAFFDDMLTCLKESFNIDEDKIHVTGMSNGGLMTGLLTAVRGELLASVAPISGGVLVGWPGLDNKLPALVIWGGTEDLAFDQNFDALADAMIGNFSEDGHFVVACDHGLGHELEASFWDWILLFFNDHPRGLNPEPYAAALPDLFPEFCSPL